jgi:2'-hydroxyisoflavone reductase
MKKESNSRRNFIKTSLAATALAPLASSSMAENLLISPDLQKLEKANKSLKILILGGTSFLGPQHIAYALQRGHKITTFTRGRTVPTIHKELFKEVEPLIGDRKDNLKALEDRQWDAVIDNSGNDPKWTKDSAELLRDNVGLYLYTSSTGVYFPYLGKDIKEDTRLVDKVPEGINDFQKVEYGFGVMKTLSEREALKVFGDRGIVVRATYMIGPADRSDRFVYWPVRLSRGGIVLVPGRPADPVQFIDTRDVAGFCIRLLENQTTGIYNAAGPVSSMNMQACIHGIHACFSSACTFEHITDYDFLEFRHKIMDMVPWIIPTGENAGSALVNNQKGLAAGLTFTPLANSVQDIFEWWNSDAVTEERRQLLIHGEKSIMRREKEILKEWRKL